MTTVELILILIFLIILLSSFLIWVIITVYKTGGGTPIDYIPPKLDDVFGF